MMKQILKPLFLRKMAEKMLDFLFPRHCFGCKETLYPFVVPNLCQFCWNSIHQIQRLSFPGIDCSDFYTSGRYQGALKKMILLAKFKQNVLCAESIFELLHRTFQKIPDAIDIITSVPSDYMRCLWRGRDLPALLAVELSKKTGLPYRAHLLKKKREVKRQSKLSALARRKNIQDAFHAVPEVEGKRILVIDDIFTTGSTALACCSALQTQKCKKAVFLAVAKT